MRNAHGIFRAHRPAATAPMAVILVLLLCSLSGCGAVVAAAIGTSDSRQAAEAAEQYFNDVLGLQHVSERAAVYDYAQGALTNSAQPIAETERETPQTLRSLDFSGLSESEKSQLVAMVFLDGVVVTSTCSTFAATVSLGAVAVHGDTALVDTKLVEFHVTGNTTPVPQQGVLNRPIHLQKTAGGWKVDARAQLADLKRM
jgi:hypothetical protein